MVQLFTGAIPLPSPHHRFPFPGARGRMPTQASEGDGTLGIVQAKHSQGGRSLWFKEECHITPSKRRAWKGAKSAILPHPSLASFDRLSGSDHSQRPLFLLLSTPSSALARASVRGEMLAVAAASDTSEASQGPFASKSFKKALALLNASLFFGAARTSSASKSDSPCQSMNGIGTSSLSILTPRSARRYATPEDFLT